MTPGDAIRHARDRSGLSTVDVAQRAGVTTSYLSKIENGRRWPTWAMIERIAAAMGLDPELTFRPSDERLRRGVARLLALTPRQRLERQIGSADWVLGLFVASGVPFALAGAAAAVVHGMPAPIDYLDLLVLDDDEALVRFGEVLLKQNLAFDTMTAPAIRDLGDHRGWSWLMGDTEVQVTLVAALPETVPVEMERGTVPVVAVHALVADDPAVQRVIDTVAELRQQQAAGGPPPPRPVTPRPARDIEAQDWRSAWADW